jgi:phenylacetate-coenzyme A ligase PaaK-like adenylate-forming protein
VLRGLLNLLAMFLTASVATFREKFASQRHIRRLQLKRFRRMVRHAAADVPYYRELYKGLDLRRCKISDIPTTSKRELMKRLPETLAGGGVSREEIITFSQDKSLIGTYFRGKYVLCTTSGTTGVVGYFLTRKRDWSILRGVEFARLLRGRLSPSYIYKYAIRQRLRWAMLVATAGHFITLLLMKLSPKIAGLLSDIRPFSIMDPIHKIVADLNAFQPHYMHGYPTFLESLAHEQFAGRLKISPDFISSGSEPFTQTARSVLMQAFPGAQLSETYGTTEALSVANQCPHGRLHINEDYVLLEAVDHEGRPVPEGAQSRRALITNLVNRFQPLIRYELSDSIAIHPAGGCPCGSPLRTVGVHGRTDDTFFLRDSDGHYHAFPPIPFEVLFLEVKGLRQYQLIHEEQNHLVIRYVCADSGGAVENERRRTDREGRVTPGDVERQLKEKFGEYLKSCGMETEVRLTLEEVDEISRPPSTQKVRQIFSKVKQPRDVK